MMQCPHCQCSMDFATNVTGSHGPGIGDMLMCSDCMCISIFDFGDELYLRKPTAAEYEEIGGDPRVKTITQAMTTLEPGAGHDAITAAVRATLEEL